MTTRNASKLHSARNIHSTSRRSGSACRALVCLHLRTQTPVPVRRPWLGSQNVRCVHDVNSRAFAWAGVLHPPWLSRHTHMSSGRCHARTPARTPARANHRYCSTNCEFEFYLGPALSGTTQFGPHTQPPGVHTVQQTPFNARAWWPSCWLCWLRHPRPSTRGIVMGLSHGASVSTKVTVDAHGASVLQYLTKLAVDACRAKQGSMRSSGVRNDGGCSIWKRTRARWMAACNAPRTSGPWTASRNYVLPATSSASSPSSQARYAFYACCHD